MALPMDTRYTRVEKKCVLEFRNIWGRLGHTPKSDKSSYGVSTHKRYGRGTAPAKTIQKMLQARCQRVDGALTVILCWRYEILSYGIRFNVQI